jgi:hypothetical protein
MALRSHRALKAGAQLSSEDIWEELRDLRDQVARLQQKIHSSRLGILIPWVDALRQQVEDRLRHERGAAAR